MCDAVSVMTVLSNMPILALAPLTSHSSRIRVPMSQDANPVFSGQRGCIVAWSTTLLRPVRCHQFNVNQETYLLMYNMVFS